MQSLPCEGPDELDLDGTWVVLARYSLALKSRTGGVVTICPQDQVSPALLLLILDIDTDASGELSVSALPCDLSLPTVSAMVGDCRPGEGNPLKVEIPIPDAMTQAWANIPPVAARGTHSDHNSFSFDSMRFTWGTREDTMPSWQSNLTGCGMSELDKGRSSVCELDCVEACEDVIDDDDDGYPGVTLHVCGTTEDDARSNVPCNAQDPTTPGVTLQGLLHLVFRTEVTLAGIAKSSCEASGTFASNTTHSIIGADAYLTSTRVSVASAMQSLPLFDGIEPDSIWRMVRVDGRYGAPDWKLPTNPSARCSTVRAHRNELD